MEQIPLAIIDENFHGIYIGIEVLKYSGSVVVAICQFF